MSEFIKQVTGLGLFAKSDRISFSAFLVIIELESVADSIFFGMCVFVANCIRKNEGKQHTKLCP